MKFIYSQVNWLPDDIIDAAGKRGMEMTYPEAEKWLMENGDALTDRLVEVGWDVIDRLLEKTMPRPEERLFPSQISDQNPGIP